MKLSCRHRHLARGVSTLLLPAALLAANAAAAQAPIPGSGGEPGKPPIGKEHVGKEGAEPPRAERRRPAPAAPKKAAPPQGESRTYEKVTPGVGGETGGDQKAPPNGAY